MKTVALTAGTNWWYPNASRRFAERWNRLSQYIDDPIPCIDLSERIPWKTLVHPMFVKGILWDYVDDDVERIMWFDSDTFACRVLGLHELPEHPFSAVREKDKVVRVVRDREKWPHHRQVVEFFNAGVFIATREAMPVFDALREHNDRNGPKGPHIDQEWLNLFVAQHLKFFQCNPTGWHELPGSWNWFKIREREIRPVILHLAGIWERQIILDLLYGGSEEIERTAFAMARSGRLQPSQVQ